MSKKSDTPQTILSEQEQKEFLALIATGLPPEHAAKSFKLSADQFQNILLANADFAKRIKKAEEQAEIFFVMRLKDAAQNPHSWRAAAWWLEHRKPHAYSKPKVDSFQKDEVERTAKKFVEIAEEFIPKNRQKAFFKAVEIIFKSDF